jgi:pimeloyl-ACP methyl ester carboxylesterase
MTALRCKKIRSGERYKMKRQTWLILGFVSLGLFSLIIISIAMQTNLPAPTGSYPVGRTSRIWVDTTRPEGLTDAPDDFRNVPVVIWYPADASTNTKTPYFPNLDRLTQSLEASGEVSALEVFGLRFIKSQATLEAPIANRMAAYPVVIFSPGNGTNVEFYSGIAEELASNGYIVVGINHPFDVAAVSLMDGSIAQFLSGPFTMEGHEAWVAERINERKADVLLTLKNLEGLNNDDPLFADHLDLSRTAVVGHSLGGITAAESCVANPEILSCLNYDGIQRGGPFSTRENPIPPNQPFMLITKEPQIPPQTISKFKEIPSGGYLVTIKNATHDHFTDGPLLHPSLLPLPNEADLILSHIRKYTLAFLDQTIKKQASPQLEKSMQSPEVSIEVFSPSGNP